MSEPTPIEVTLPAPAAEVWRWFREPALIRRWHGWEYEGDSELGLDEEIRQIYVEETVADADARTLHIGGHLFTLNEQGDETRVEVTRAEPVRDGGLDWNAFYDEIDEGWLSFLQQLRFALAHHPEGERQTIRVSGDETQGLLEAVAEAAEGEEWFRSEHQVGVRVDAWGPGLLLAAQFRPARSEHGRGSLTLSTYGLDDATRDELEERWRTWFEEVEMVDRPTG